MHPRQVAWGISSQWKVALIQCLRVGFAFSTLVFSYKVVSIGVGLKCINIVYTIGYK